MSNQSISLDALLEARGGWVSAQYLHGITESICIGSNCSALRKKGYLIENSVRQEGNRKLSWYRLLNVDHAPPPELIRKEGAAAAQRTARVEEHEQSQLALPESSPPATRYGIPD